jgi:hypothetical protein
MGGVYYSWKEATGALFSFMGKVTPAEFSQTLNGTQAGESPVSP